MPSWRYGTFPKTCTLCWYPFILINFKGTSHTTKTSHGGGVDTRSLWRVLNTHHWHVAITRCQFCCCRGIECQCMRVCAFRDDTVFFFETQNADRPKQLNDSVYVFSCLTSYLKTMYCNKKNHLVDATHRLCPAPTNSFHHLEGLAVIGGSCFWDSNKCLAIDEMWGRSKRWELRFLLYVDLKTIVDGSEILQTIWDVRKPCKRLDKLPINWCRISSINSIDGRWPLRQDNN